MVIGRMFSGKGLVCREVKPAETRWDAVFSIHDSSIKTKGTCHSAYIL